MAMIDDLFYKYKHGTMETGFRWHTESFQCEESAMGEVNFIWMSSSNTEFTIQMLTDLHIPRIRWSGYNISQSGCLTYDDTQRDSVSGKEVTRNYKVKFRAEFELQSDKNLHVVQFKRIPEESETTKRWVFEDYNEGMMYLTGEGFNYDFDKAKEMFRRAADNEHPGAIAMLNKLKLASAADYIPNLIKAKTGEPKAQLALGLDYYNGTGGVEKDFSEAFFWMQKSADQGNLEAFCNLGTFYMRGQSVEKNESKGLEIYQKAADRGLGRASLLLGDLYKDGNIIPQDKKKAKEFYIQAIEQGFEPAKKQYEELTGKPYNPPKSVETSSSSSSSSYDYDEKRGGVSSAILGAVGGFGIASFVGFVYGMVKSTEFPGMFFLIALAAGFLITFSTWKNKKTGLFALSMILTVAGFAGNFMVNNGILSNQSSIAIETPTLPTAAITSGCNFRTGPSTNDDVIRQFAQGDIVTLTGETSGTWTQVSHNGDTGWVSTQYVGSIQGETYD